VHRCGALAAVLLVGVLAGCASGHHATAPATATATPPPESSPDAEANATVAPIGLRIPSIGVDSHAPMTALGLDDRNQIKVPDVAHPEQLGWYCPMATVEDPNPVNCGAPEPGRVGPAVILGHINGNGKQGVFSKLSQVKVGATVEVDRADGNTVVFTIAKVQVVDKTAFPTDATYSDVSHPAIRVISCGGRLDKIHHRYLDQVILFGDETDVHATVQ